MNTEATDETSPNSGRLKSKSKPFKASYNNGNEVATITLEHNKTPDSKEVRTITYNNEMDALSRSRNDDAVTCKRDGSKFGSQNDTTKILTLNMESQLKKINVLNSSNEKPAVDFRKTSGYSFLFDEAAAPLEELTVYNPELTELVRQIRFGFENA
mmetsp:Transcript_32502/g.37061  ORF Transcript_32502/g.37061 Transcript_32502/m.37061 type:complete len:156 (-) Transcript_32502:759-1226(-)